MKKEVDKGKTKAVDAAAKTDGSGVSRRTFVKGLGAIGTGTILFSGSATKRAKGQYGDTYVDGLSQEQLIGMYTDMLKIRLWESKIKDLILAGGFRGVAHLYVGEEAVAVGVSAARRRWPGR